MSTRVFDSRWLDWEPGAKFRVDASGQGTDRTNRSPLPSPSGSSVNAVGSRVQAEFLAESDDVAAVLIRSAVLGEVVWLLADEDALTANPDIAASGLPVFFFAEVPQLQRLDAEGLRAVAAVKRVFPTSRVLQ